MLLTVNPIGTGGCVCEDVCPEAGENESCGLVYLCGVETYCGCNNPSLTCNENNTCVPIVPDCGPCGGIGINGQCDCSINEEACGPGGSCNEIDGACVCAFLS